MTLPSLYLGLVHGPVKNKMGDTITTSITNMDIHDISRSAKTFGIQKYFLISPMRAQYEMVERIIGYWHSDEGNDYNPDRATALKNTELVPSLEDAIKTIENIEQQKPMVAVTAAKMQSPDGCMKDLFKKQGVDNVPLLLLFGTGWGLTEKMLQEAHFRLNPIYGAPQDHYNHLSVRSAVAIYLNRLCELRRSHELS